ncbi:MAG: site-specific integrase [Candidatus Pacearchaeota archaeon]|jgi:integrase
MRIDPYNHKEKYFNWKERVKNGIPDVSPKNSEIIIKYATDMERGLNVAVGSAKGSRSFIRLNSLREKMTFFAKRFKEICDVDSLTELSEDQVISFFCDMRNGVIKRKDGNPYMDVYNFVKDFKAFWHWWIKINKKNGITINDITVDLDSHRVKPKWVYLSEDQVKKLIEEAKPNYKILITFLFDTGIRAPTELINIQVSDLYNDCKELNIRHEVSKTFGRRIKLLISSESLKQHIKENKLNPQDRLFSISPPVVNRYLRRLSKRVFGDGVSLAGEKYSNLTMYDFRHVSCCYWLPRYKSESAMKYRFGWKKSDKIL